jgi:hypothetical protein
MPSLGRKHHYDHKPYSVSGGLNIGQASLSGLMGLALPLSLSEGAMVAVSGMPEVNVWFMLLNLTSHVA